MQHKKNALKYADSDIVILLNSKLFKLFPTDEKLCVTLLEHFGLDVESES